MPIVICVNCGHVGEPTENCTCSKCTSKAVDYIKDQPGFMSSAVIHDNDLHSDARGLKLKWR